MKREEPVIEAALGASDVITSVVDLVFGHPWSSALHTCFLDIVQVVLDCGCIDLKRRLLVHSQLP
jgi:hypothetical protein